VISQWPIITYLHRRDCRCCNGYDACMDTTRYETFYHGRLRGRCIRPTVQNVAFWGSCNYLQLPSSRLRNDLYFVQWGTRSPPAKSPDGFKSKLSKDIISRMMRTESYKNRLMFTELLQNKKADVLVQYANSGFSFFCVRMFVALWAILYCGSLKEFHVFVCQVITSERKLRTLMICLSSRHSRLFADSVKDMY